MRARAWVLVPLSWVLASTVASAEPSLGEAQKHVEKKDLISCKFTDKGAKRDIGAFTSRSGTRFGPTKAWWRRNLACLYKVPGIKGVPNAKLKLEGEMWWAMAGGKFVYDSWSNWKSYDGIPAPTEAELEALVRDNFIDFRTYNMAVRITAITKVALAAKPDWWWEDPNQLKVNIVFEFEERSGDQLLSLRLTPKLELRRKEIGQPWKVRSSHPQGPEEFARRPLTPEEQKTLVPLVKAEANRKADAQLASLPKVEIPAFVHEEEAAAFTFKMLRETDAKTLEVYLRQMLSSGYREATAVLLVNGGEEVIKKAVEAAYGNGARVNEQYCASPLYDSRNNKYYNKDESAFTRLVFKREGGEYRDGKKVNEQLRITALEVRLASGDKLAKLTSYAKDPCNLGLPKASGKGEWKRGDRVRVQRGSAYPAVIYRIRDDQAQVIQDSGDSLWVTTDKLLEP